MAVDNTSRKLEDMVSSLYSMLASGDIPEITMPSRNKENIVLDPMLSVWRYGESTVTRSGKAVDGAEYMVKNLSLATGMELYLGKMIVELRIPGVNKGKAIRGIRNGRPAMIVGDDLTDEDAYRENPDAFSIHIGDGPTAAKHSLGNYLELRGLLTEL